MFLLLWHALSPDSPGEGYCQRRYEGQHFPKITPKARGTAQFAQVALDCARQSMTLLLNKGQALPIPLKSDVVVIGPYGDYGTAQGGVGGKLGAEITRLNGAAAAVVKGSGIAGTDRSGGSDLRTLYHADHGTAREAQMRASDAETCGFDK